MRVLDCTVTILFGVYTVTILFGVYLVLLSF